VPYMEDEVQQIALEKLILLVIGSSNDKKLSSLHLQKEVFLLWNFHPDIKTLLKFIKHYKGPFSREIAQTIKDPLFLYNCWKFIAPPENEMLTGGYLLLTQKGKKLYSTSIIQMKQTDDDDLRKSLIHLISGIKMINDLYSKLSPEELLLLFYDTYPNFTEKSNVYDIIYKKRDKIAINLYKKDLIDEKRCISIRGV